MTNPFKNPRVPVICMGYVLALLIMSIGGTIVGLALPFLPKIEGYMRPVVGATRLTHPEVTRVENKACFSLRLRKLAVGAPIVYQFELEVRQNEHWLTASPVNAHIANDDDSPAHDDYQEHPVGDEWNRRWCFDMPASVAPWQVIRVSGYAVHRAHPIWDTHTPLPAFVVPGV